MSKDENKTPEKDQNRPHQKEAKPTPPPTRDVREDNDNHTGRLLSESLNFLKNELIYYFI